MAPFEYRNGLRILRLSLASVALALFAAVLIQVTHAQNASISVQGTEQIWVGWIVTKAQNLRLIVRLSDTNRTTPTGTIVSPDQTPEALPLSNTTLDANRNLTFQVDPQGNGKVAYSFQGKIEGDRLQGELEQAGTKVPIRFIRTDKLPAEGNELLGADTAWIGSLDVGTRKVPLRFRVYNTEPYATPDKPRILFDSLLEKANGFPVGLSMNNDGAYEFSVPAIPGNAKYIAKLSEDGNTLNGKFQQGFLPLNLELRRVDELKKLDASKDSLVKLLRNMKADSSAAAVASSPKPMAEETKNPEPLPEKSSAVANLKKQLAKPKVEAIPDAIVEDEFVIERLDGTKPLLNELGKRADNRFELAGTITYPPNFRPSENHPAVVLITGSGPQDRDETIGRHKPFLEIAKYLASLGMVVLRYDDRGVGRSTGDFLSATTNNFADDARAVWQYARSLEGVDKDRVGLLGHSEGGIVGPMVAAWQREVAFLLLIAPPGLTGSEVLSSQLDRIAELQGVGDASRAAARSLQSELQRIALKYPADDESALTDVRKAVLDRWQGLSGLSEKTDGSIDAGTIKKQVLEQITAQFRGLQSPWMRHFLAYDPSSNWVLFDCPVFAIWGEKDVQVLPGINRSKLETVVTHNTNLQADFLIIPNLNHLMQTAKTGLPDEYESIDEAISPVALEAMGLWLRKREILP